MNVIPWNFSLSAGAWPLAEICLCIIVFAIVGATLARLMSRRLPKGATAQLANFMIGIFGVIGFFVGVKLFIH